MRKIRIAQIGTSFNSHGSDIFSCLKKQKDIFEVVGYAFPENERKKFSWRCDVFNGCREMTVDEIMKDTSIEAVAVETEECFLTKYALMAAENGKHIHMEKPGGQEKTDFERLISEVKRNGKIFHTGYMYRHNPFVEELTAKVKIGDLGDIISVEAQMNCEHSKDLREWLGKYKGGSLYFLGCHLIDLILRLKGTPDKIIPLSKQTGNDGLTSTDFGMAVLEYGNGVCFAKVNSNERGGFVRRQLVVSGTKGTVEIKPLEIFSESGVISTKTEYTSADWCDRGVTTESAAYDRYDSMMCAFASYVSGDKENPYTPDYELELYKTVLECCGIK